MENSRVPIKLAFFIVADELQVYLDYGICGTRRTLHLCTRKWQAARANCAQHFRSSRLGCRTSRKAIVASSSRIKRFVALEIDRSSRRQS